MQKVCNSEDSGLNDALKLARRVENDGVVASAALELSGTPPQLPGTATTVETDDGLPPSARPLNTHKTVDKDGKLPTGLTRSQTTALDASIHVGSLVL